MMFGNNGNRFGASKEISVNTGVHSFFSDEYSLSVGCWNDKFSIKFLRAIGRDENGKMKYDRDNRISTSLSLIKAAALLLKYKKKLKPMLTGEKEAKETNFGVKISAKDNIACLLLIQYKPDESGVWSTYLVFERGINPDGSCSPQNRIEFKFSKTEMVEDMNLDTGVREEVKEEADFFEFISILESRFLMTGLSAHAKRYSDAISRGANNNQSKAENYMDGMMDINASSDFASME